MKRIKKSKHHVPPKKPDKKMRVIVIDDRHHRAYHLLFGNSATFIMAAKILWKYFWAKNPDDPFPFDETQESC